MTEGAAAPPLTEGACRIAMIELAERDATLVAVVSKWGIPPFWVHLPGFPGIVLAILGQQVSLESAQATYGKLEVALGAVALRHRRKGPGRSRLVLPIRSRSAERCSAVDGAASIDHRSREIAKSRV